MEYIKLKDLILNNLRHPEVIEKLAEAIRDDLNNNKNYEKLKPEVFDEIITVNQTKESWYTVSDFSTFEAAIEEEIKVNLINVDLKLKQKLEEIEKDYSQRLKNSNLIMKELNKELEENEGSYPDIEFGQDYEAEEAINCCYDNFVKDLQNLKKELNIFKQEEFDIKEFDIKDEQSTKDLLDNLNFILV